jgi:hypothetical protein
MARRINLSQIGSFSQEKYEQLLRAVVLQTDSRLKQDSPVDTGRLRMSWAISENSPAEYDAGPQSGGGSITPPRRLNYAVEQAGNVYHISNSLPYAEPVLYGTNLPPSWGGTWRSVSHSMRDGKPVTGPPPQIKMGYPDLIAREMTDWARQTANQIGRQD